MRINTEFLFAHWAVPKLKDLRGSKWQSLVEHVAKLSETDPEALAFALTMIRINSCATCNLHRYHERGGCAQCSRFVMTNLNKESETSLLTRYKSAQKEIDEMLATTQINSQVA